MFKIEGTIKWLTQDDNPSVKYYTLKNILSEKLSEKEIAIHEKNIESSFPVKAILDLQDSQGWWLENKYGFSPYYKNTFWQVYFLSLLGLSKKNEKINQALNILIKNMQSPEGSFPSSYKYMGSLICFQGITLEMLMRLGYYGFSFTEKLIGFIIDAVYANDFRCKYKNQMKCPWGAIKVLKGLNLISSNHISSGVLATINKAKKFLISHDIVEANYPRKKSRSTQWHLFGFPRGYQSDILELTVTLVDSGCKKQNHNLKNALKYIYSKCDDNGCWKLEHSLNGKMLVDIEKRNRPSKWITYFALKTLLDSNYIKL